MWNYLPSPKIYLFVSLKLFFRKLDFLFVTVLENIICFCVQKKKKWLAIDDLNFSFLIILKLRASGAVVLNL